jgi:hypothetical protein
MRGKLATVIDRIEHGHHVFRAYFKNAFLKQYEKFSTFLRNELVSNNLADFRLRRRARWPSISKRPASSRRCRLRQAPRCCSQHQSLRSPGALSKPISRAFSRKRWVAGWSARNNSGAFG